MEPNGTATQSSHAGQLHPPTSSTVTPPSPGMGANDRDRTSSQQKPRPFCAGFVADAYYSLKVDVILENILPQHEFTKIAFTTIKHVLPTEGSLDSSLTLNKPESPKEQKQPKGDGKKEGQKEKSREAEKKPSQKGSEKEKEDSEGSYGDIWGGLFGKKKKASAEASASGSSLFRMVTSKALEEIPKVSPDQTEGSLDHTYMFFNMNRSFVLVDITENPKHSLVNMTFNKGRPVAFDVNQITRSCTFLEVVIGVSSGEIVICELFSQKFKVFTPQSNRPSPQPNTTIPTMPTEVKWVPGSENLFVVAFNDGTLFVYDKDLEQSTQIFQKESTPSSLGDQFDVIPSETQANPTACWLISDASIKAMEFSPDSRHLATVGKDGILRIFNFEEARLIVGFHGYFGGLSCVCWSPDGKYLLTGGEDDLVSVWNFEEQRIVARCEGHQSWVTGVAFDPFKSDDKMYRFGSVGEDTKLLLWDFSVAALNRPRSISVNRKHSVSKLTLAKNRPRSDSIPVILPATPRNEVPIVEPIMAKRVHIEPICSVGFREDCVITACRRCHLKIWLRPEFQPPSSEAPKDVDNDK